VFPDALLLSELSSYPHHHVLYTPVAAMQILHHLLLLGLAHCLSKKRRARFKHSQDRKDIFRTLSIEKTHRCYRKIP
jgi:hypothetical protein